MGKTPHILIGREKIALRIAELAARIKLEYAGKNPLLLCVLKGGFVFMADLVRQLDMPVQMDFMRVSSYGGGMECSGSINVGQGPGIPLQGRDVLIVEDIVDMGFSLSVVRNFLSQMQPASLKLCALLDKPSRRKVPVCIDYLGFTVPDKFVVGYGIDFDEQYRYLPDVCFLEEL